MVRNGQDIKYHSTLARQRSVRGAFCDVGYIIKRPGHAVATKELLERFERNRKEETTVENMKIDLNKRQYLNDYFVRFDALSVRASVNRLVEQGLKAAGRDFEKRQNKLKVLMLNEQSVLIQEYTNKAQKSMEIILKKQKKKAQEIMDMSTDTHAAYAQMIYERMAAENSDSFKAKVRFESSKNTFQAWDDQVHTKLREKQLEKEDEKMWNDITEKAVNEDRMEAEMINVKAKENKRLVEGYLEKQIAIEKGIKENQICLEKFKEDLRQKVLNEREHKVQMREESERCRKMCHAEALAKQIETNQVLAKKKEEDDLLLEQLMSDDTKRKIHLELLQVKDFSKQKKTELAIFKDSMELYKKAFRAVENEGDLYADRQKRSEEFEAARKKNEERRLKQKLKAALLDKWKCEMEKKAARNKLLREENIKYRDVLNHKVGINEKLDKAKQSISFKEMDTKSHNKEIMKYSEILQKRVRLEDENMLSEMRRKSQETDRKVRALLREKPVVEIVSSHAHPFYERLKSTTNTSTV